MTVKYSCNIIVIDASVRFAFHVWRYLARSIGIGRNNALAEYFWEGEVPRPLRTGSGEVAVWWIPGDRWLKRRFRAVRKQMGEGRRLFMIDVKGLPEGSLLDDREIDDASLNEEIVHLGDDGQYLGYEALKLIEELDSDDLTDRTVVVSSYETGTIRTPEGRGLRIVPKSRDTLHWIERQLPVVREASSKVCKNVLHVLVTGAGFEIGDKLTCTYGLPPTTDLLREMEGPFCRGRLHEILHGEPRDTQRYKDLDAWWNWLLETALSELLEGIENPQARMTRKAQASQQEREMREAFRQAILRYDRGQMNQSLQAAALDWQAWLTTNYTGFADRALQTRAVATQDTADSWQIVSSSIAALSLEREIVHQEQDAMDRCRYLFKLHGDIGHLQTMATAGYDKELFSMLSVPVDSLHQVYSAAATYLSHVLERREEDTRLVWHVVGHGLGDWLLLHLMGRVCRYAMRGGIDFVVVGPAPRDAIEKLGGFLRAHLRDRAWRITSHPATAAQYMAQITSSGGLPAPAASPTWVSEWLSVLDPGAGSHLVEWLVP